MSEIRTKVQFVDIDEDMAGQRIDNFLRNQLKNIPKSMVYRIVRKGEVRVNKKRVKAEYKLQAGDLVRIPPVTIEEKAEEVAPSTKLNKVAELENMIIHEDDHMLILNKPSGTAVHGGSGLKYSASTIITLSKKKEKDGKEVVGNIIKAKTAKSRLSRENQEVEIRLYYDERGLDRYYGLLELGEVGGLWKNVAGRYEIDGKKVYAKQILKDPETYFTPEVMEKLDLIAKSTFSYGDWVKSDPESTDEE